MKLFNKFSVLMVCLLPWYAFAASPLVLHVNQNQIITVDGDIQDVFVSDPKVVVVHAPSSRHVMVSGKDIGSTDLLIMGENAQTLAHYKLNVDADL